MHFLRTGSVPKSHVIHLILIITLMVSNAHADYLNAHPHPFYSHEQTAGVVERQFLGQRASLDDGNMSPTIAAVSRSNEDDRRRLAEQAYHNEQDKSAGERSHDEGSGRSASRVNRLRRYDNNHEEERVSHSENVDQNDDDEDDEKMSDSKKNVDHKDETKRSENKSSEERSPRSTTSKSWIDYLGWGNGDSDSHSTTDAPGHGDSNEDDDHHHAPDEKREQNTKEIQVNRRYSGERKGVRFRRPGHFSARCTIEGCAKCYYSRAEEQCIDCKVGFRILHSAKSICVQTRRPCSGQYSDVNCSRLSADYACSYNTPCAKYIVVVCVVFGVILFIMVLYGFGFCSQFSAAGQPTATNPLARGSFIPGVSCLPHGDFKLAKRRASGMNANQHPDDAGGVGVEGEDEENGRNRNEECWNPTFEEGQGDNLWVYVREINAVSTTVETAPSQPPQIMGRFNNQNSF